MSRNQETVFIEGFKVAVALSIIKNKPLNLSTGEYMKKLTKDYRQLQYEWKSKYEASRNEVLALKQKSVLYETNYRSGSSWITECEVLFPTQQSFLEFFMNLSMKENTIFLEKFVNIRHSLNKMKGTHTITKTVKDTILHSLEAILKRIQNDKIQVSMHNIEQCLRSILEINSLWYGKEYRNINSKILDILNSMVSKLLDVGDLNPVSTDIKEDLKQFFMSLIKTNHLSYYADMMSIMMMHCAIFCEKLRTAQCKRDIMPCSYYENMIYLVEIITRSLKCNKSLLTGKEGQCLCKTLQLHVDKSLLHISSNFPLVTHTLWKISGILQYHIEDFH